MSTKYIASNWRLPNKAGVDSYLNDNYGLTFDGNEDIDTNNTTLLNGKDSFSISCWIKPTAIDNNDPILISRGSSFIGLYLSVSGSNYLATIQTAGSTFTQSTAGNVNLNEWNHITATGTVGSKLNIYVNNNLENTTQGSGNMATLSQDASFVIAKDHCCGGRYFEGSISEVAIFDYSLSESQISTLYGSSSLGAGNPMALKPAPVAFYPLGDNSSGNPLTQPNEAVEDASVFDFNPSSNQYINCGNILDQSGTDAFSISGWFYLNSTKSNTIVSKMNSSFVGYQLYVNAANKLKFLLQGTGNLSATGSTVLSLNTWYNVILTYDGSGTTGGINLFLNGATESFTGSGSNSGGVSNSENFEIGARTGAVDEMDGLISNVAIWNSDQSAEISNIYNSGVPATTYTNTPTAWYKLDQSANWEADSSGAWQIPDAVSAYPKSFDFPASNDFISIGSTTLGINTAIAISAWVKTNINTGYSAIINEDNAGNKRNWNLLRKNDDIYFIIFHDDTGANSTIIETSTINVSDNNWHHVVGTWDGTTNSDSMKVYFDGVEVGQATPSSTGINTEASAPWIGNSTNQTGGYFNWTGQLSNIQVWNTALSFPEVTTLYNSGVPLTGTQPQASNLKAWYKLDNTATFSTNWSIPDASGNGNTGTSSGMTEQNLVNNNVSALNGESSGMTSANLVLTNLTRNLPYDSYSFNFDGVSAQNINVGTISSLNSASAFTIGFWGKLFTPQSNDGVIFTNRVDNNNRITIYRYNSLIYFHINVSGSKNGNVSAPAVNTWTHIAMVFDGSGSANADRLKVYYNGVEQTLSFGGTIPATTGTYSTSYIGARGDGTNEYNGLLNNITIFNQALTSTEVMKLYSNGMPQDLSTFTPTPIHWWTLGSNSFFNGSNFICKDLIGSNDGTSVNAGVDALQGNTPRSEANGTGTNNSIPENLVGTTKYSSNNSWSINMSESARVADTP